MRQTTSLKRRQRNTLTFESLERRETPAQFGLPWVDAMHLTTSFAPDGAMAVNESSNLQSNLDAQLGRAAWQSAILKAMQTWSEAAGVNIGLTADSGVAFGTPGDLQGDTRMGDIRVGGFRMSPDVMAISSPPSSGLAGTIAGDIFINTQAKFTRQSLYAAALHEVGHSLGVPNSTNPKSVMYTQVHGNTSLSAEDVQAIRALYGVRPADANEGDKGNETLKNATRIRFPSDSVYTGATPLVQFGDLTSTSDVDMYYLRDLSGYRGPVTFYLRTQGISLLQPKMTIMDASGRVVGQVTSTKLGGDLLKFTIPQFSATHYLRVEAAAGSNFRIGRYSLAATFDDRLKPTTISLADVMRGPYESLKADKVDELFRGAQEFEYEDDLHTDDREELAVTLKPTTILASGYRVAAQGTLTDGTDIDFYRLRAPASSGNAPWVLTVTINSASVNGIVPQILLSDSARTPVKTQVIARDADTLTIQATGIAPDAELMLKASGPVGGNYHLEARFGRLAASLTTFTTGNLTSAVPAANHKLYIAQSQVFGFTLSTEGAPVELAIRNSLGQIVYQLATPANGDWSSVTPILPPGEYSLVIRSLVPGASARFQLRGDSITDPIGPIIDSGTLKPIYRAPQDPTRFLYPDGSLISNPWLLIGLA